ncbi:L,D-transpeptidase [Jatrophihabitans fulvus]
MQHVGTQARDVRTVRTSSGRRRTAATVLAGSAVLLTLAACTSGTNDPGTKSGGAATGASAAPSGSGSSSSATSSAPAAAAAIATSAVGGLTHANPAEPVEVKATNGTLTSVKLVNPAGLSVSGAMADDGTSWHTTEDLAYSRTYTLVAQAKNADGATVTKREHVTTLQPNNMTMPSFVTIAGDAMTKGGLYGVGMVVGVHFDEPIPDKVAAEKILEVKTSPSVQGAWYWLDDQTAHWRPKNYYAPGTKVQVTAKDYGHDFGGGLYGQSDIATSFTIGQKRVSIADASTHQVKVYFGDKLVRTMPTSMGQGGIVPGKTGPIYLWTMPGTYTVIAHENPATMSSDSYGLPASSPYGYAAEKVPWATKISTDGIYLHELDTTVWAQGNQNVSHGCLNLNQANAQWYFQNARVGDIVKVVHSGGPAIQVWQGGDWSVPWATWAKGGAAA